jgi:hypothetical protein
LADESNPLGVAGEPFVPPDEEQPAEIDLADGYDAAPAEPIEWTPERAGALVKGAGFMLHAADPVAREPEAAELWRATEADVEAIGPPLSRILNRYAPARALAGVSDEAELAFGMLAYAKRNLATRGRAISAKRERDEPPPGEAPEWAGP